MKSLAAVLVLCLLCGTEARLHWNWQFGRNLLQVTPLAAQTAPATTTLAAPTIPASTTQTTAAGAPAAAAAPLPGATAATPAPAVAAPAVAATPAPAVAAPAVAATPAPAAPAVAATPAAPVDPNAPPASPSLVEYKGQQGVYVIADPPPAPKVAAAPAGVNKTANATAGPPPIAAGKNLMVVLTVMGQDAKDIYKNQQALRQQLAAAAGLNPSQIKFYNQTANSDPRTGVTALSLSMAVDCGNAAACATAGNTLQNTTSQTKLSDNLARDGISMMDGTFQVFGVSALGKYKGNDTLYENKAILNPTPVQVPDYNTTMAMYAPPILNASALPGALPGAVPGAPPGMPLGNFTIPGFAALNTSTPVGGVQPGFNLSSFQTPTQSLLPSGAVPYGVNTSAQEQQQPVEPLRPRNSASSSMAGTWTLLAAVVLCTLLV